VTRSSPQELLRLIPAVDQFLLRPRIVNWVERTSHGFVVSEIQRLLREVRSGIQSGEPDRSSTAEISSLESLLETRLESRLLPALRPVVNGTGVILHTNLGRAPLSKAAQHSLSVLSGQYTNLDYDLNTGERSHRDRLLEQSLTEVLGCETAAVVNNNAAAVFLILNTLASGREVIVSRGELVEIGGAFRIPDIMARSGAVLREVGTTNKTRVEDYAAAIGPDTALLFRVHPSNYRMLGFTHRPELREVLELARRARLPVLEDLGSGCLVDLSPYGIRDEPVAQKSIAAGVDLVCFSGDKLFGGPQAGIIAGSKRLVDPIRKNPLMRTYRVERLIYGALEATIASYRTGRALEEIPVLRLISAKVEEIRDRSRRLARKLRLKIPSGLDVKLVQGTSVIGGGSCPECHLPTTLLALVSDYHRANSIESRLRAHKPPIILRIEEDRALIDLRTVFPEQETTLIDGLVKALS
jgi:L-seryl-tRNA(Ser) seleniumtransferase